MHFERSPKFSTFLAQAVASNGFSILLKPIFSRDIKYTCIQIFDNGLGVISYLDSDGREIISHTGVLDEFDESSHCIYPRIGEVIVKDYYD